MALGYTRTDACLEAGISLGSLRNWIEADEEFAKRVEDAYEQGTDVLEKEAQRRAQEGVQRPIFQGGVQVGKETVYSDKLMEVLLTGRRPAYRKGSKTEEGQNLGVVSVRIIGGLPE